MATQLKDGRWRATWVNPETNKREAFYSREGEADAEGQKSKRLIQWQTGEVRPGNDLESLAMRLWWPTVEMHSPNTIRRYLIAWNGMIAPAFASQDASQITRSDVQQWANALIKQGKKPATVRHVVSVLATIFYACLGSGNVILNPATKIKLPPRPKRRRVMTLPQLRTLLGQVEGTNLAAPVFLAAVLGMRRGEACGLKWSSIDMVVRRIRITEQRLVRQNIKGKGVIDGLLKTGSSERSFVIPKSLLEMLQRVGDLDSGYVCTNASGKPWNPEKLTGDWCAKREELGFATWHFHDLRHGAAGILVALGVDLLTIAAILGHSSIKTSELYAHAQEATASKGLDRVGKALFPTKRKR